MSDTLVKTHRDFVLPTSVITKVDVSRLVAELEKVDNDLTTASVRALKGGPVVAQPVLSPQLTDFLIQNELNLNSVQIRSGLVKELRILKDVVPVIHMTFAVNADPESLQQLALWLRTEVSPQAVIAVGLQPGLVAGVYLRTPNHVHDLSLRQMLRAGRGTLVQELGALRGR